MINLTSAALKVYLATKPTAMRKSFNGVCALAYDHRGENAIPITKVGAKNFLFFGSAEAGNQNSLLYTILENCKVHGLCPEDYLCQTIEALNALGPDPSPEQIAALTPARVAARQESETQAA